MIPDQQASDQIPVTLRRAVEAILPQLEAAARGAASLDALETAVGTAVRTLAQEVVTVGAQRMATGPARAIPACPTCGQPLRRVAVRPRTVLGIFGAYALTRSYWVCPRGHGGVAPADAVWGLGTGTLAPRLVALLSRLAVDLPFDAVSAVVAETLGVAVDGETIRRTVEAVGQAVEAAEHAAAVAPRPPRGTAAPEGVLLLADGAMIHTDAAWHEAKVGVCQPLVRTGPTTFTSQGPADYCVGFESRAAFWPRFYAHAVQTGIQDPRCQLIVLIGDGAHWIWDDGAAYFGEAGRELVEILDFYHAAEHLATVAHAVWGEGTPAAQTWWARQRAALLHEGPAPLFAALAALAPPNDAAHAVVTRETAYFRYHATRLHYPTYRARGLPIGSGQVEGACKVVLKHRLAQAGMRWRQAGAQAVATLRARHRSGQWDPLWATGTPGAAA